jgi:arylsulfatase A-like enzyme
MSHGSNVVFILADNVGYGVLSSYNGGILDTPTPRIDSLASEGIRLTNFNVENQCTPSRAALMRVPSALTVRWRMLRKEIETL